MWQWVDEEAGVGERVGEVRTAETQGIPQREKNTRQDKTTGRIGIYGHRSGQGECQQRPGKKIIK